MKTYAALHTDGKKISVFLLTLSKDGFIDQNLGCIECDYVVVARDDKKKRYEVWFNGNPRSCYWNVVDVRMMDSMEPLTFKKTDEGYTEVRITGKD